MPIQMLSDVWHLHTGATMGYLLQGMIATRTESPYVIAKP